MDFKVVIGTCFTALREAGAALASHPQNAAFRLCSDALTDPSIPSVTEARYQQALQASLDAGTRLLQLDAENRILREAFQANQSLMGLLGMDGVTGEQEDAAEKRWQEAQAAVHGMLARQEANTNAAELKLPTREDMLLAGGRRQTKAEALHLTNSELLRKISDDANQLGLSALAVRLRSISQLLEAHTPAPGPQS